MTVRIEESPSTPEDDRRRPPVADPAASSGTADTSPGDRLVEEDLLVEDVSIDGMCGVY